MIGLLIVGALLGMAVSPTLAQDIRDTDWLAVAPGMMVTADTGCIFYTEKMQADAQGTLSAQLPIIDWSCAEKFAASNQVGIPHSLARALIAVREHKYVEKSQ